MHVILGAPGSGKSTILGALKARLPDRIVLDWDGLMVPAGRLAGADIRMTSNTWDGYSELVRTLVENIGPERVVLLGVRTPEEMAGWPPASWIVLDCSDAERIRRLRARGESETGIKEALEDAAEYRRLGLFVLDNTLLDPAKTADRLAARIG